MYFKPSQGFFFLIAGIFLVFLLSGAANGEVVGKFTYVEGTVDVLKGGKLPAFRVSLGDPVSEGDIVRTKSQSKAEITFMDGSILKIAQRTRIDIEEYLSGTKASLKLPRGKVEALVPPHLAKKIEELPDKHKFEIKTPIAVAGVRGTDFFSFHQPAFSGVIVKEGVVQVYNLRFPEVKVRVSANEMTIVREARPPELPRPAPKEEIERHEREVAPIEKREVGEVTAPGAPEKAPSARPPAERAPGEAAPERVAREEVGPVIPPRPAETVPLAEAVTVISEVAKTPTVYVPSPAPAISPPIVIPVTEATASLDTTPPGLSFLSKPPLLTNSPSASFLVLCDDPSASIKYFLNGNPVTSTYFPSLSDGTYTFVVEATDKAGNVSSLSYSWTVDTRSPSVSFVSSPPSLTRSQSADFSVSCDDPTATLIYKLDGKEVSSLTFSGLSEGTHTFEVIAKDQAGNSSSIAYSWTIDLTPPSLSFTSTPPSSTNSRSASFGVSSEPGATLTYFLDGNRVPSPTLSGLSEGTHTFTVEAMDQAGNKSSLSYSWTVVPTPTSLSISVNLLSIEPGSVKVNYQIQGEREITVKYRLKDSGSSEWGNWENLNTIPENTVNLQLTLSPGASKNLEIQATDSYGNTQTWESGTISPRLGILSGKIHTTNTVDLLGAVASVVGENKGVAKLNVSESVPVGDFQSAGGDLTDGESRFFVYSGSHTGGGNFDTSFKLLTTTHLFSGSGNSVANLSASGEIISLTTAPSISVEPLNFSTNFNGMFHYYDGSKINEVSGTWAKFLLGRTGTLQFPSGGFVDYYTDNYLVGLENSTNDNHVFWGNWNSNLNSIGWVTGYGAGFLKEGLDPAFALYGLYIAPDGAAGFVRAFSHDSQYLCYVGGFSSLARLEFEKEASGHQSSYPRGSLIEGSYQGFFTGGGGTPTISQQKIRETSDGFIGSATLSLKKGSSANDIEPWGVFGIEMGGSHSATSPTGFVIEFGGESWDNRDDSSDTPDFWVGSLKNTSLSDGKMYGQFSGKFMTPTHYGYIKGDMLGQFNSHDWVGVAVGEYYPVAELKHLSYSDAGTNVTKIYQDNFLPLDNVKIHGYLGGDEFWSKSSASLYAIGKFDSGIDFSQGKGYVYYASPDCYSCPSGIAYKSFMAGRAVQKTDGKYNINAYIAGVYQDGTNNKGIFIGNLSDDGTSNVLQLEKRFFMEGENTVKAVTLDTGAISPTTVGLDTAYFSQDGADPGGIYLANKDGSFIFDSSHNFGVGFIGTGGSYSTAPTSSWYISYNYNPTDNNFYFGAITQNNNPWGNDGDVQNVIKGKTYGYYADLNPSTPVTGIFVGETVGTFNPADTTRTWQTVTAGAFVETKTFLSNAYDSKLGKINIPVVEVGRVDLSYSNSNCGNDCIRDVSMNNVKFFAPQTGKPPVIWATDSVSGSFNGNVPTSNYSVTLTGEGGFTVNFTPTVWDTENKKWAARISGSGSISGYTIHDMRGVAAGTISGSSFSGTAAGTTREPHRNSM